MKKILALSIVAIATAVGCTSPGDQLCIATAECAGEEDGAAYCSEQKADLDEDEQACADSCKAQTDAYGQCALDNGSCEDEVWTVDPADACEAEAEAFLECFGDC